MDFFKKLSFKTVLFRAYLTFLTLLAIYAIVGIVHFKLLYISVEKPKAEFLIKDPKTPVANPITVTEFLDYTCQYCKELSPIVEELLTIRKDIRYIARPIAFDQKTSEPILRYILAAGLQGKFWEMHTAVLEYPEDIVPQDFLEQTASLYGLDIKKLSEDAKSKHIDNIIKNNINVANHAGIQFTPSFLIGSKIYSPSNAMPTLVDLINMVQKENKL